MPDMPYRVLGRTGQKVSAIGLGGWHLSLKHVDAKLATRLMQGALEGGINFFDNSWDYNDGESEKRMGSFLADGHRKEVFLMTKIDGRTYEEATRQLEQSLKRLKTDCIDLVQHHEILRFDDPHRVFREDGANAALVDAQKAGKLRFIGFTGHKDPLVHLHMLETAESHGYVFDTVQMPLNVMDAHYRSFAKLVIPELQKHNIGVLGMKSMADRIILESKTVTPIECLHYALNLPTSVVITGMDSMEILGAGSGRRPHVPAHGGGRSGSAAEQNAPGSSGRQVRTLQDVGRVRRHRRKPEMAGRRTRADYAGQAGLVLARALLHRIEELLVDYFAISDFVDGDFFHEEAFALGLERDLHFERAGEVVSRDDRAVDVQGVHFVIGAPPLALCENRVQPFGFA